MCNNKVRRRDHSKLSLTTTQKTTDKHIPPLRPKRIPTIADRTFFDTYIKPKYDFAMQEYQLFCGMAIAAIATLCAVIRNLYTPRTRPQWRYRTLFASKKSKGKKGKKQPKIAAPRKVKAVKSANPPPPQPLAPQTSQPAASHRSKSVTSIASANEGVLHASPTQAPAIQIPLSSPSPSPAPIANDGSEPVKPAVHEQASSAEARQAMLALAYSRIVDRHWVPTLSESQSLWELLEKDKSDKAALLRAGLDRLRECLETDLRIDPGRLRTPALMAIIKDIHFAMAPEYSLPLQGTPAKRFLNSREVATVFLNRYGSILWPDESEPAPHLIDRSLQFARDSTVDPSRYWEWMNLGHPHPKKGSLTDLQISKLGIRMTKFVGLVYDLPIKQNAGVDWHAIVLVLDDLDVREETLGGRFEDLPGELKRQILRLD